MTTDAFYGAASGLSFTMLGFWWAVVTFRHAALTATPAARRFAFLVSLYFLLPGLVSLASLLAGSGVLWRIAFASAGIAGIASVLAAMRHPAATGAIRTVARWSWLGIPLYALVTLIAVAPEIARSGLGLEPLQVEGLLLVGLLFLGSQLAWWVFAEPKADEAVVKA